MLMPGSPNASSAYSPPAQGHWISDVNEDVSQEQRARLKRHTSSISRSFCQARETPCATPSGRVESPRNHASPPHSLHRGGGALIATPVTTTTARKPTSTRGCTADDAVKQHRNRPRGRSSRERLCLRASSDASALLTLVAAARIISPSRRARVARARAWFAQASHRDSSHGGGTSIRCWPTRATTATVRRAPPAQ